MSNRISGILLLTLIALCVVIVLEVRSGVSSVENSSASRNRDESAGAAGPVNLTLPPLAALSETVERPLFNQTRRPPEDEPDGVQAVETPVPTGSVGSLSVSAIVITETERAVLLIHPQSGELTRVAEGETVAGWRLELVQSERAVFSKNGETREVRLRTFGPPPARRPQRSAPLTPGIIPRQRDPRRTLGDTRLRPLLPGEEPGSER